MHNGLNLQASNVVKRFANQVLNAAWVVMGPQDIAKFLERLEVMVVLFLCAFRQVETC